MLALAIVVSSSAALARPAEDPREVQGRKLFAKGEYEAALEVYANLFAEKSDPIYLRNIGRCHQKLEQPWKKRSTRSVSISGAVRSNAPSASRSRASSRRWRSCRSGARW